ncbi:unnamed protein product [Schistosoma curassoni]|uniref:Uncharacterized protein n=1 Tax=Schistosoma curassoni TaxID=6186 RepID=A0A183JSX4_9TREM|nr:unnamed protein product [Schistosoma curassoni]
MWGNLPQVLLQRTTEKSIYRSITSSYDSQKPNCY